MRHTIFFLMILIGTSGFKVKGFESLKPYSAKTGLSDCKIDPIGMECFGSGTIAGIRAKIQGYYWRNAAKKFILASLIFDMDPQNWDDLIETLKKKYGPAVAQNEEVFKWENENDVIKAHRGPTPEGTMWLHYFDKRKFDLPDNAKLLRKEPLKDF